ncbi:MAG: formylglycine-generating enzyme family protein [Planctomycetota bacterium]
MKSLSYSMLFFVCAMVCFAQTPVAKGPVGRKIHSPKAFNIYPAPYESPTMEQVPGGDFDMGDHHDGFSEALPIHTVLIDAFNMDTFEVTNEEYCAYLNSAFSQGLIEVTGGVVFKKNDSSPYCETTLSSPYSRITWNGSLFGTTPGKADHPMVMVSWYGAVAYANWRSAQEGVAPCYNLVTWECTFGTGGYRLPTEAEWEKAARGGEYSPYYRYPWGDYLDEGSKANFLQSGDPYEMGGVPSTTPVGYYNGNQTPGGFDMANGYGLYDMSGNVWEWCNDWYQSDYYSVSPYDNPKGPSNGTYRVIRGGSWGYGTSFLRTGYRTYGGLGPYLRYYGLGFRLVRN